MSVFVVVLSVLWLTCGAFAAWIDADGQDPRQWASDDWLGAVVKTMLGGIALIVVSA